MCAYFVILVQNFFCALLHHVFYGAAVATLTLCGVVHPARDIIVRVLLFTTSLKFWAYAICSWRMFLLFALICASYDETFSIFFFTFNCTLYIYDLYIQQSLYHEAPVYIYNHIMSPCQVGGAVRVFKTVHNARICVCIYGACKTFFV